MGFLNLNTSDNKVAYLHRQIKIYNNNLVR